MNGSVVGPTVIILNPPKTILDPRKLEPCLTEVIISITTNLNIIQGSEVARKPRVSLTEIVILSL